MIESSQWRLPVRRVDPSALLQHKGGDGGEEEAAATRWEKSMTVERFRDKLFGGVSCLEYSPNDKYLAVSAKSQSLVLRLPLVPASIDNNNKNNYSRKNQVEHTSNCVWNEQLARPLFATRFRSDDKLIVQTVERRVSVRSTETAFSRNFDGHTRDVHDAFFLTGQIIVSASDDCTVRLWDLTQTGEVAVAAGAHSDYVRSICPLHVVSNSNNSNNSNNNNNINQRQFISAGYDKNIFLWDVRSGMRTPSLSFSASHGISNPVEKVVSSFTNPNHFFAAAADVVMMFDIRQNQIAVAAGSFHTKTVTSLAVVPSFSSNLTTTTLLTGGLDKRLRIVQVDSSSSQNNQNNNNQEILQPIATRKANTGITSIAVNPTGTQFCIGTIDGFVSAFDVPSSSSEIAGGDGSAGEAGGGAAAAASDLVQADRGVARKAGKTSALQEASSAVRKEKAIASWLRRIHALLTRFRYGLALKTALYSNFSDVLVTTLDELQRRCALHVAISGHTDRTIVQLLRFASDHVSDPKLTATCITVMDRIFEIYGSSFSSNSVDDDGGGRNKNGGTGSSEYFFKELLKCHRVLEEMAADIEFIRSSCAMMELICNS